MPTFDLARIGAGLPVATAIDEITGALAEHSTVIVEAPPGTGKTTLVPPVVADLTERRVVVAQPRRVAARAAARRLAHLTGTELGDLVGFTVRGESRRSRTTRVEFVTTGVLVRRLVRDPELTGVGAVVLDEVHERQVETDLALAMCHEVQQLRELPLVVMSATLQTGRLVSVLDDPPVVSVTSPLHPLSIEWAPGPVAVTGRGVAREFLDHVADRTVEVMGRACGSALVFLPGVREVEHVVARLQQRLELPVFPLHGRLSARDQDAALSGDRRVVVSTSLAESSLTVDGVHIVVDSGLSREPRWDAGRNMSGLVTVAVSRAAAEQRAGRAGRLGPGTVVRCWAQDRWAGMAAAPLPEILTADLTNVVLELACWGAPRGEGMALLDPLPPAATQRAEEVLRHIGAVDDDGRATPLGRRIVDIPTDPRAARALLDGAARVGSRTAAEVVALLDARAPGADLEGLWRRLHRGGPGAQEWRADSDRLALVVDDVAGDSDHAVAVVTALAFPDQIARRRGTSDGYLLARGTGVDLPPGSPLSGQEWLAVAGADVVGDQARITAAAALEPDLALDLGADLITEDTRFEWKGRRLTAMHRRLLGAIELSATARAITDEVAVAAVRERLVAAGSSWLDWSPAAKGLRRRLAWLAHHVGEPWPDVSDPALAQRFDEWLAFDAAAVATGRPVDLAEALRRLIPWQVTGQEDELAPERLTVPTGSRIRVDYPVDAADAPVLAVKLQECFGLTESPRLCGVPVVFHLLSPAGRPLAITDDLASFWAGPYAAVRAENRGRYAKHPWPEDPLTAPPRRGTTRSGR